MLFIVLYHDYVCKLCGVSYAIQFFHQSKYCSVYDNIPLIFVYVPCKFTFHIGFVQSGSELGQTDL